MTSVRYKLVATLFACVFLALFLAGAFLLYFFTKLHGEDALDQCRRARDTLKTELRTHESDILKHLATVARREDVIASMNLISAYETPADYTPILFDEEKKKLAETLAEVTATTHVEAAALFNADKILSAFVIKKKQGGKAHQGFLSYQDGRPAIFTSDPDHPGSWREVELPPLCAELTRLDDADRPDTVVYRRNGAEFYMEAFRPVRRTLPDDRVKTAGYIRMAHFSHAASILEMSDKIHMKLQVFINGEKGPGTLEQLAFDDRIPAAALPLFGTSAHEDIVSIDHEEYFLYAFYLSLVDGSKAYFVTGMDKTLLEGAIRSTAVTLFLVMLISALVIIFIGIQIANRMITNPIAELARAVDAFRDGRYIPAAPGASDEIGVLARSFNEMAAVIARREQEIRSYRDHLEDLVEQRTADLRKEIAERKLIQQDLQVAKEAAESANRAKSEFLANMSHELRTPLNGILGYAQILKKHPDLGPDQLRGVDVIERSGNHLLDLINEILDFAKIEARKMDIQRREMSLNHFIFTISKMVEVRAREKGLDFSVRLDEDLPAAVRGDEKRLGQILINLMGNAVKFTDRGRVALHVQRLTAAESAPEANAGAPAVRRIRFEVTDTGVGIPPDRITHIFTPFEQVKDNTRFVEGTGLGLSISRKLAGLMGGELLAESAPGAGSRFWFDIDMETADAAAVSATGGPAIKGFKGPKKRILTVDDRWENRIVMTDLLTPLGFDVIEAADGADGIDKAARFRPDLIFMDLAMPGMDGTEAARRIRALQGMADARIVAFTASAALFTEDAIARSRFNDFIAKPVVAEEAFNAIERQLGVEWIYAAPAAPAAPAAETTAELVLPPRADMAELLALTRRGDIMGVRRKLDAIAAADAACARFAEELRELAREFRIKRIRERLRAYMG